MFVAQIMEKSDFSLHNHGLSFSFTLIRLQNLSRSHSFSASLISLPYLMRIAIHATVAFSAALRSRSDHKLIPLKEAAKRKTTKCLYLNDFVHICVVIKDTNYIYFRRSSHSMNVSMSKSDGVSLCDGFTFHAKKSAFFQMKQQSGDFCF